MLPVAPLHSVLQSHYEDINKISVTGKLPLLDLVKEGSPSVGADLQGALHLRKLITIDVELTKLQC